MKKISFTLAIAAMAAVAGCTKETVESPANLVPATITTTIEKTSLNGTAVNWESGDQITVWDGETSSTFTLTGEAGGNTATFSGLLTEGATPLYAIYPAIKAGKGSESCCYESTSSSTIPTVTGFEMPKVQYAVKGNFTKGANASIGEITGSAGNYSVTMHNIGMVFKVTIPSSLADIKSVSFCSATGGIFSGKFSIVEASIGKSYVPRSTTYNNEVILQNENGSALEAGTYYLVALPSTNATNYKSASARNTFKYTQMTLTKFDGTVAHKTLSVGEGDGMVERNTIMSVDLTGKELSWNKVEEVVMDLKDLSASLSANTSIATRTKSDLEYTVGGHTFNLVSQTTSSGISGYYWSSSYLIAAYYTADDKTKVSSGAAAYIGLPSDFDGYKLYSVRFYTNSQDKTIAMLDKLSGGANLHLCNAVARQGKPASGNDGCVTIFCKTNADTYYIKCSHSGTFNIYKEIRCTYEKPVE